MGFMVKAGMKSMDNKILSNQYNKLVVYDELKKEEIAVITKDIVTTANSNIVIKLTPCC